MTDKEQIIINGVDVSDCEYLTYQLEEDGQYYWFCNISPAGGPDECEYKPECSYKKVFKQLACKTQECEKLKEKFKKFFNIDNQECWDVAFLKDENARYTKALERIEYEATEEMKTFEADTDTYGCFMEILNIISKAKKKGTRLMNKIIEKITTLLKVSISLMLIVITLFLCVILTIASLICRFIEGKDL